MTHPETHIVTPDNGPRPAGAVDRCFYRDEALGQPHKADCVCRQRTVVVEYRIQMAIDVPEDWTPDQVEFCRGGGSGWCADNALDDINALRDRDSSGCLCGRLTSKFIREATAGDDKEFGLENLGESK